MGNNTSTLNGKRQELAERIHANAVAKGFWDDESLSPEHYAMLVITELSEAVEAHRKGRWASKKKYENTPKTWTPADVFNIALFESCIKDSVEDELADAYIRLLDMWGAYCGDKELEVFRGLYERVFDERNSFTEQVFTLVSLLGFDRLGDREQPPLFFVIHEGIALIETLCTKYNIDLLWHIEEKMRYNESRPRLHGKEY